MATIFLHHSHAKEWALMCERVHQLMHVFHLRTRKRKKRRSKVPHDREGKNWAQKFSFFGGGRGKERVLPCHLPLFIHFFGARTVPCRAASLFQGRRSLVPSLSSVDTVAFFYRWYVANWKGSCGINPWKGKGSPVLSSPHSSCLRTDNSFLGLPPPCRNFCG